MATQKPAAPFKTQVEKVHVGEDAPASTPAEKELAELRAKLAELEKQNAELVAAGTPEKPGPQAIRPATKDGRKATVSVLGTKTNKPKSMELECCCDESEAIRQFAAIKGLDPSDHVFRVEMAA